MAGTESKGSTNQKSSLSCELELGVGRQEAIKAQQWEAEQDQQL